MPNVVNISSFSNDDMIKLLNGLSIKILNKTDTKYLNKTELNNEISKALDDVDGKPVICTSLPTEDIKEDRDYYLLTDNKYVCKRYIDGDWKTIGSSSDISISSLSDDQINAIIDYIWIDNTRELDNGENAINVLDVSKILYKNMVKVQKLLEDKANSSKPVISDSITIKSSVTSMTAGNIYAIDIDSDTELWILINSIYDGSKFTKTNINKNAYAIRCYKYGIKKYSNILENSDIGTEADYFGDNGWKEIQSNSEGINVYSMTQAEYDAKVLDGSINESTKDLFFIID